MIEIKETKGNLLSTIASEKLTTEDYEYILPKLTSLIDKYGKIKWFFTMEDFHGWELKAMWMDLKFDVKHANDFEKIAMVGDKKWEELLTDIMKPFTGAKVKYFDKSEQQEAETWINK